MFALELFVNGHAEHPCFDEPCSLTGALQRRSPNLECLVRSLDG